MNGSNGKRGGGIESRSTTFGSEIEGARRRALIMGGRSDPGPEHPGSGQEHDPSVDFKYQRQHHVYAAIETGICPTSLRSQARRE